MPFLYLIPAVASATLFLILWWSDDLSHPRAVGACCFVGLYLQFYLADRMVVWLAGLLINCALGIYLAIRIKLA
jgi:hypothetical protein